MSARLQIDPGGEPTPPPPAQRRFGERAASYAISFGLLVVFVAVWQIVSATKAIDPFFISTPLRVLDRLREWVSSGPLWRDTWVTLREALLGFVLGVAIGVVVGFVLGHSRILARAFLPILNLLNTLPRVALAPLFILWFGLGQTSKIFLVFSVVVVILVFNTYAGMETIDADLVTNARLLGANRLQVLLKVTFPWTLPWILTGARVALAWSIGGAVIGEYIGAREGLGFRIFQYSQLFDQTSVLAGCIVLVILSGLMFAALTLLERYLLRWRPAR
jgi:NitT/TauT family transport system permease protein